MTVPRPELAEYTVGEGPGLKLPLLNRNARAAAKDARHGRLWRTTICVVLPASTSVVFVRICDTAALDLAQPARARGTHFSHSITTQRRCSRVRMTSFVESGPLFAVGNRSRELVLPLPQRRGMGWGTEIDWFDL